MALPARQARVPVFGVSTSNLQEGAVVVAARDYFDGGHQAGLIASRVMRGEHPSTIPFQSLETVHVMVNLDAARSGGIRIPRSLIGRATRVIGKP